MLIQLSKRTVTIFLLLLAITIGVVVGVTRADGQESAAEAGHSAERSMTSVKIEIAENGTRFTPDEAPVFEEDGFPAYGSAFVTEGYIYPEGTLANAQHGGSLEDGSPEFPDEVLGTWTCWGYHVADGAHTVSGPIVATTQLFDFGDVAGEETIVSIGFEYANMDTPFERAITGGTGKYRAARGTQTQNFVGWNDSVGVMLEIEFMVDTIEDRFLPLLQTSE